MSEKAAGDLRCIWQTNTKEVPFRLDRSAKSSEGMIGCEKQPNPTMNRFSRSQAGLTNSATLRFARFEGPNVANMRGIQTTGSHSKELIFPLLCVLQQILLASSALVSTLEMGTMSLWFHL